MSKKRSGGDDTGRLKHTRCYEHIIRNKKEFYRIADYIRNNPARSAEDRYHPDYELGGE